MGIKSSLSRDFFNKPAEVVAPELLGKYLVRQIGDIKMVGKVVETEAYLGEHDSAAHSSKGRTKRTEVLYGEAGRAYIYQIHRYHCLNVSTEEVGNPGCVLIRALEPIQNISESVSGPGRLCRALDITKDLYGVNMTNIHSPIYFAENEEKVEVEVSPRIGITKAVDWPLRFYIKDNLFVSR